MVASISEREMPRAPEATAAPNRETLSTFADPGLLADRLAVHQNDLLDMGLEIVQHLAAIVRGTG